jgi:hypothetical protein
LVVFASWIGWGQILFLFLPQIPRDRLGVGLLAGWGMCVMLFFGGVLNATVTCGVATLTALTVIGSVAAAFVFFRWHQRLHFRAGYLPLFLLTLIVYSASVCWRYPWNPNDDFIAYLVYPIKMLQSGAAIDPFSLRRLSTLGGYSFLQATIAVVAQPQNAYLLDIGLGGILASLLTIPPLRRAGASPFLASLPGIICMTIPLGRINSMSTYLSVAAFLILFRTLNLLSESSDKTRIRLCWIAGLVAAGITTLRPNFLPVVGLALLVSELLWPIPLRQRIIEFSHMLAASICSIIPWSIALHAAANSWFYPIFPGNQRHEIELLSAHLSAPAEVRFIIAFFLHAKMLLLVLAGAIGLAGARAHVKAIWIAAVIGAAMVVSQISIGDYANLKRYVVPPIAAAAIVVWIDMQCGSGTLRRWLGRLLMVCSAFALSLYSCFSISGSVRESLGSIDSGLIHRQPLYPDQLPQIYAQAQASLPPGRRILTMTDYPFLFDYHRNPIDSIDWPGFASPLPGLPFFQGSDALAKYLRDQSIDALIVSNFDDSTSIYSRQLYQSGTSPDAQIRRAATHELDLMRNIDELARTCLVLFNRDDLRVIQLRDFAPQ